MTPLLLTSPNRPPLEDSAAGQAGGFILPRVGDVVAGKYRIEKIVGEGGMGIVYAAHHLVLDQRVALKLLLVDALRGAETVERFVREARAAARLRSEHVVRVTDAGALDSGLPFLVMEYLQGCDLAELASVEGPLQPTDVADYVLQVLAALAQAHAAGIVHRDLKPANLFLSLRDDGTNVIKILDFGISKQSSQRAQWKELTGKAVLGTPAYMSPEQLRSSRNVDARADIWSLGVVMYELLSGKMPFDGESPGELFAAILEKTPEPLRTHRPGLAQAWEDIVTRCIQRDPEARFADVVELARAIAPLGSGGWSQTLPAIEHMQARATRSQTKTDTALVDAAIAAAVTSFPPPMRPMAQTDAGLSLDPATRGAAFSAVFAKDRTLLAEIVPVRAGTSRRRPTLWSAPTIAGVFLVVLAGLTSRVLPTQSAHSVAGTAPSRALAADRPPPAAIEASPPSGPAASVAADVELPESSAGAFVVPEAPKPAAPRSAPVAPRALDSSASAHRRAPRPAQQQVAPRPKFLKSW